MTYSHQLDGMKFNYPLSTDPIRADLQREHNDVLFTFARHERLRNAASEALETVASEAQYAHNEEHHLLGMTHSEGSWTARGGHEVAARAISLARKTRLLAILSGERSDWGSSGTDGYLTWADVILAIIPKN